MPRVPNGAHALARAAAVGLVALGAAVLLDAGPVVARDAYPRILSVDAGRPPQVELEAIVPPLLAGQTLGADAFQVVENGRRLPVTSVARFASSDLRVLLVLDTAVAPATLAAEQGAARDFVFQLPERAEVGVVATDPEPNVVAAPGTDRGATVRALVGLQPTPPISAGDATTTLELALSQLPARLGTGVVVMVDSSPSVTAVPEAVSGAVARAHPSVYSIVLADPPPGYLGGVVARSGGRVIPVQDQSRMLSAYAVVVNELLGRYRLRFATTTPGRHTAGLTVSAQGIRGTTAFVVPGTAAMATPSLSSRNELQGSTRKQTSSSSIRLLAGLLLAALLVRLGWRVAHRA